MEVYRNHGRLLEMTLPSLFSASAFDAVDGSRPTAFQCADLRYGLIAANVRFWLLADIQVSGDLRPLYPRKQTLPAKNWIGP